MYRHIVVPVDGSDVAEQVLPQVEQLATSNNSRVTIAWVTPPVDTVGGVPVASEERWQAEDREQAEPYLQRVEHQLRSSGIDVAVARLNGPPAHTIVRYADQVGADLIAMTTHGRTGIRRIALGSVAEEVVRHANCPVLLIRAR